MRCVPAAEISGVEEVWEVGKRKIVQDEEELDGWLKICGMSITI